ncbi:MAG TPA: PPOX class F420-dependent oxidoreductase [Euzebyales bacterium]|nr:PPOX class F420-dependent oxidoreductase [Euzebyales bacterium]
MSAFSDTELAYFRERKLGRVATVDADGVPHVVPVGWSYNAELDTIDVGGRDLDRTRKFRNVRNHPYAAFVVDDVLPPWRPRAVQVRGPAEAIVTTPSPDGGAARAVIRITPAKVNSWGLEPADD